MHRIGLRSICLSLIWEDGQLAASISDFHTLACIGSIEVSATLLLELSSQATQLLRQASPIAQASQIIDGALEQQRDPIATLGALIYSNLLPENIRVLLRNLSARPLFLQMNPELISIPWEISYDDENFLGAKFMVSRYILQDKAQPPVIRREPDSDGLKVFVIHSDDDLHLDFIYAQGLLQRLKSIDGISAKGMAWGSLSHQLALRLIEESDIVHCVGALFTVTREPLHGDTRQHDGSLSLADIAGLETPPELLILERTESANRHRRAVDRQAVLAAEVSRTGLLTLFRSSLLAGDDRPNFMAEFYFALAHGRSLAQAQHYAATQLYHSSKMPGSYCLEMSLYGDATRVLIPDTAETQEDDNHRQITILSYDLVESTKLLSALGAEKYSEVLDRFHGCCAQIVHKWGGAPDNPHSNDGIMCYFGLPTALEDAAGQALHAAIEVIDAIAAIQLNEQILTPLRIRIGIVTGPVVVKAGLPVGVSIHHAARLQSIAEPGSIVVSASTRQIVRDRFDFLQLDQVPQLKGITHPGLAYRLIKASHPVEPGLRGSRHHSPFVGRELELSWLASRWACACEGKPATILISGEAGIGKSRLLSEFKAHLMQQHQNVLECRCTFEHTNSALRPIIELILRHLHIKEGDAVGSTLAKLKANFGTQTIVGEAQENALTLLAGLLNLPSIWSELDQHISAEKQRQSTMTLLVNWVRLQASATPLCLIIEDAHWIDPSTRELMLQLIDGSNELPLMVLMTERSDVRELRDPRRHTFNAELLDLKALGPEAAMEMILGVCDTDQVANDVIQFLSEKADGVPLFIEESVRMFNELIVEKQNNVGNALSALKLAVPSTIQDLLMARLDRLGGAKQIAQLGGAMGREFTRTLMQAVLTHESSPLRSNNLSERLHTLVHSGVLIEKGEGKELRYVFRHTLLRDAAYQSLWERDRRKIHRAIALTMNQHFPNLTEAQPELLAHHYTAAGLPAPALQQWERAARLAVSRSAHEEAINHVKQALTLLPSLPVTKECERIELRLQLLLAAQLIATEGYGAERVGTIYQRATSLCDACGDQRALLKVQFGLEGFHFIRGDFKQAHAIAAHATELARLSPDPMSRVQAQWALANLLFHEGELKPAVAQMDACLSDYHQLEHRPGAVQDPGIMCLAYSALAQSALGKHADALLRIQSALKLSEQLQHKFSLAETYGLSAMLFYFRADYQTALDYAQKAIVTCEEAGFAIWLAHAKLIHGRCIAQLGDPLAGNAEMAEGYAMWCATGAIVTRAFYLAIQAEGLALASRPDDALALLQTAFDLVSRYGERYYEPEIRRLYGVLLLQSAATSGQNRQAEAERWLQSAMTCAQERQMQAFHLRAALSLAELWKLQGRVGEARDVLAPLCHGIAEGERNADLATACQLLASLKDAAVHHVPLPPPASKQVLIWDDTEV